MTKCGLDDFLARHDATRLAEYIVDSLPDLPSGTRDAVRPVYRRMSDVEPRTIEWLWPGYIVRRKVNLLAGYGGVGKGQVSCNLIARLSRGDTMPNSDHRVMARTLILAAEDDPNEDLRPRLDANGANTDNIIILDGVAASDDAVSWVDVQKHAAVIEHVIRTESIDLLYIDPVSSYMPGTDRNSQGAVRDALGNIQRIVNETGVTVLATVHLGKASERKGAQRILGSVEFVNLARNVLGVNDLPDEHQPDDVLNDETRGRRKVIQAVKSNSGIPGPPLSFSRPLDSAVVWHGIAPVGFDDSFAVATQRDQARQDAKAWLFDFLKGGMKPQSTVERAATDADISKATLRRAKNELGVESKKIGFPGIWHWHLPPSTTLDGHYPKESIEDAHMPDSGIHSDDVSTFEDAHMQNLNTFAQSSEGAHMPDDVSTFAADSEDAHIPRAEHVSTFDASETEVMDGEPWSVTI